MLDFGGHNKANTIFPIGHFMKEIIEKTIKTQQIGGTITGIPSGFLKLDNFTNGFHRSELIVIAARPSMGKTAFILNIASFISLKLNYAIGFFSLEMNTLQLVQRIISAETQIDLFRIRNGDLKHKELVKIIKISKVISHSSFYIDETPSINILKFKERCHYMATYHHVQIIFVDYLQLIHNVLNVDNRSTEIAEISQNLKAISRELNIPIIVVSQLNRNVENRLNKRPLMCDLRESGSIEQDADIILFLYRKEYYTNNIKKDNDKGLTEIILSKNRNGPIGTFFVKFYNNIIKFVNLTEVK